MELIGRINYRKIYYLQVRNNPHWKTSLPKSDWVAFIIANEEDEELIPPVLKVCINNDVSYTCSAGTLADKTENYFDEEISWIAVDYELQTKLEFDYGKSPSTIAHRNFSEGFWFASTLAYDAHFEIDKVVCIDLTKKKVQKHLIELIERINQGDLPSDEEIEFPQYDN